MPRALPTTPSLLLVRAAHPRQALATAAALAAAAAVAGRPLREVGLVAATVLVGQCLLGWADDLTDRRRDTRRRPDKPLADDRLDPGTVWFALTCAVLLVVPLAVAHGRRAGATYLALLAVSAVGDRLLHARPLSFVPWVATTRRASGRSRCCSRCGPAPRACSCWRACSPRSSSRPS